MTSVESATSRLGATWSKVGTQFVVPAPAAGGIELCLWEEGEERRIPLERRADGTWRGLVPNVGPGTRYGYRAYGDWNPARGQLYNPSKLLLDPTARLIDGSVQWHDLLRAETVDHHLDPRDSATVLPRAVVARNDFDWQGDRPLRTPWADTVIYECHVRGLTQLHRSVPEPLRGKFLGLASKPILDHLLALGVTAVELLPVTPVAPDARSAALGLTNYWGYNPYNWFAPDPRFATEPLRAADEFREMVRRLHAAGLEVLLDVVLNHSGEGNRRGPMLSLRGLDNATFYRHFSTGAYQDLTGCGNTLDFRQPIVRRLALESLRFWTDEMHVDGFRFDLAPVMARGDEAFDPAAPFLMEVHADPVLSACKLIAEPWDLGSHGYQLGRFPRPWAEWNDRYRDTVRRFWRGAGTISEFTTRLAGSSDLYASTGRPPQAGISLVTCHDGFTLRDLVSYAHKHNEANGEHNRDGRDHNESHPWGPEGPSDDPEVVERRERVTRTMLATLALSLGVPMLSHGDERGRTQLGNNNAYCQDSPLTWVDWSDSESAAKLTAFVAECFALRRRWPTFRSAEFRSTDPTAPHGVEWLKEDAEPLSVADWSDPGRRVLLARHGGDVPLLVAMNAGAEPIQVRLPAGRWRVELASAGEFRAGMTMGGILTVAAHSVHVFARE